MKASVVNKIFFDLKKECDKNPNGVQLNIDLANGVTTNFCICSDTEFEVNVQAQYLTLQSDNGTEWIDTDSIIRIHI